MRSADGQMSVVCMTEKHKTLFTGLWANAADNNIDDIFLVFL